MRRIPLVVAVFLITGLSTSSHADCTCEDWVSRDGYCVDYVKSRIPTFPIPQSTAEIAALKNKETPDVAKGDVAIFDLGTYWHVAYVEKVHLDQHGTATAIDVSEMNFGGRMSFDEYRHKWSPKSRSEWKRALCCGVTDKYDQTDVRTNVPLVSVKQIWSPAPEAPEERGNTVIDRAREVVNRFILFTERAL